MWRILFLSLRLVAGASAATGHNPPIFQDLPDIDILHDGENYYTISSNFEFVPNQVIMRSADLRTFELVSHIAERMDSSPAYNIAKSTPTTEKAYGKGFWASSIKQRPSDKMFYFAGCERASFTTIIYKASAMIGPWEKVTSIPAYLSDTGLFFHTADGVETAYVGNRRDCGDYSVLTIRPQLLESNWFSRKDAQTIVHQLSPDMTKVVKKQVVYTASDMSYEGMHGHVKDGYVYILTDSISPTMSEYVLRSTSPWGPYVRKPLADNLRSPIAGASSVSQGNIVEGPDKSWWYVGFCNAYPLGRVPVIAKVIWSADGWPQLDLGANTKAFPATYDAPGDGGAASTDMSFSEDFSAAKLPAKFEWNHNPVDTAWKTGSGLELTAVSIVANDDLYQVTNTLAWRAAGPSSTSTVELDVSKMADGDRAISGMLEASANWIGVVKDGTKLSVTTRQDLSFKMPHTTTSLGTVTGTAPISTSKIWLRTAFDGRSGQSSFSYSTDGTSFSALGKPFKQDNVDGWFAGPRFIASTYATKALGGVVTVLRIDFQVAGQPITAAKATSAGRSSPQMLDELASNTTLTTAPSPVPSTTSAKSKCKRRAKLA